MTVIAPTNGLCAFLLRAYAFPLQYGKTPLYEEDFVGGFGTGAF